jgi:hypothetical protein
VEAAALESQSRYITRPALAMDALEKLDDGTLALKTPPDPRTGATRVVRDPLEWIHRISAHIPDPRSHCQRCYGADSNRGGFPHAPARADKPDPGIPAGERDNPDFSREARGTWARLIRKIFEADPLTCRACGARMRIVSLITDPREGGCGGAIIAYISEAGSHDVESRKFRRQRHILRQARNTESRLPPNRNPHPGESRR